MNPGTSMGLGLFLAEPSFSQVSQYPMVRTVIRGLFSNAQASMPACWRKAPGLCGVLLLAVSFRPTDARHASPFESGQSLRPERLDVLTGIAGLGFNSFQPTRGRSCPVWGSDSPFLAKGE
jgi:hypothetical protein